MESRLRSGLLKLTSEKSTTVFTSFFLILVLSPTAQVTEIIPEVEDMTTSSNLVSGQCYTYNVTPRLFT